MDEEAAAAAAMDEEAAAAMDEEAAASASKKRKRDEPEPQDPPASRDGGGDEGLDLISHLPDELLGTVISLLPGTKEAARTAILSSRWRHIWRTTPLNLVVDRGLSGQEHNRIAIVSKILAAHPGPAHRLFLSDIRLSRDRYAKFYGWFRSPALDGLEDLHFTSAGDTYCRTGRTRLPRPLPPSVLRFAPTLRAASIGRCDFPEISAAPALLLPRLKQLNLYDVVISDAAISRLLAGCIVLERLELESLSGLSAVRIVSPTLRSICVSLCSYPEADVVFQELVIEDAPCLERLISMGPVYGTKTIRVMVAPKSHGANLPRLKRLYLYDIAISEEAIHLLLAGCIMLEALELHSIRGLSTVRVVSPTLRSIGVSVHSHSKADVFHELVIEDAPCLDRLTSSNGNGPRTIRIIAAPKLTVLGYVSTEIFKHVTGTIIVKEMIPINFIAPVRTVKILALESIGPNLDAVIGFLRCFPCTEKLYIQSSLRKDMKNVWQHDMLDPIECLDLHLRKIVLDGYEGMRPDVNFAKFFVLNSRVLKIMRFGLSGCRNEKWMANQQRRLQLDNRASRNARFDFKYVHGYGNMHIHDMRKADPFDS